MNAYMAYKVSTQVTYRTYLKLFISDSEEVSTVTNQVCALREEMLVTALQENRLKHMDYSRMF